MNRLDLDFYNTIRLLARVCKRLLVFNFWRLVWRLILQDSNDDGGGDYWRRRDDARRVGFQFKVGRTCRDFNVQNAYAKLFAPLVARSRFSPSSRRWELRGPWRAPVDKVHVDVATAKISKSDQWRQVERDASRSPLVVASPHAGHSSHVHFEVRAPKDKLLFRGGRPALKPLQSALRYL